MRDCDVKIKFNNKGLIKMFPGSKLSKKKIILGGLEPEFLIKALRTEGVIKYDYNKFEVIPDSLELEGNWNQWELSVKIKLF